MNKQELRKRIEVLPYAEGPIADTITINRNWILESIEQLDEPKKSKFRSLWPVGLGIVNLLTLICNTL